MSTIRTISPPQLRQIIIHLRLAKEVLPYLPGIYNTDIKYWSLAGEIFQVMALEGLIYGLYSSGENFEQILY